MKSSHILAAVCPRPMDMVPNLSLGPGLSPGVTFASYLICIFMNVNENFKNKVRIIEKKKIFVIYL